jgi:hypothetical protein
MSRTNRLSNPIAVAMKLRYGRTSSVMKDRRAPRGGSHNDHREMMEEYENAELYTSSSFYEEKNAEYGE